MHSTRCQSTSQCNSLTLQYQVLMSSGWRMIRKIIDCERLIKTYIIYGIHILSYVRFMCAGSVINPFCTLPITTVSPSERNFKPIIYSTLS